MMLSTSPVQRHTAPVCLARHPLQNRECRAPHTTSLSYRAPNRSTVGPGRLPGQGRLPCSSSSPQRPLQRRSWVAAAGKDESVDFADRAIAGLVYIVPLLDSMRYGSFIFRQFPWVLQLLSPLLPILKIYAGFPLGSLIVFFGLYQGIINNQRFSRFVRYNGMQAVLLSIIQIVASLIIQVIPKGALTSGPGVTVFININNAVWLYTAICVLYAVGSCVIGEVARLPLVAGAADQRVP